MFQALRPLRPLRQVISCHGQELIQVRAYATAPKTQSNAPLYLGLAGVVRLNQWGKADKKAGLAGYVYLQRTAKPAVPPESALSK